MDKISTEVWLVAIALPVVTLFITQLFSYLNKRTEFKRPQQNSKLEDQYQKVLAPLHRVLSFGKDDWEQKREEIELIMKENYHLTPQPIVESWNQSDLEQFRQHIHNSFQVAANKLGYAQIKLKGSKQKQAKKLLAKSARKQALNESSFVSIGIPIIAALIGLLGVLLASRLIKPPKPIPYPHLASAESALIDQTFPSEIKLP